MRYVIAVAAPIGGGKSSLVNEIANRLKDATTIYFDNYETETNKPIDHLVQWIENGADCNDFNVAGLPDDLKKLKAGESIIDPITNEKIESKKYIILEMPLGKEHHLVAEYIDLLIWVKIPLDIALARKIKEFTESFLSNPQQQSPENFISWINGYIDSYLKIVREVLEIQEKKVSVNADIIIDGQDNLEVMVQQAIKEIVNKTTH
jgi:uridine kinase